MFAELPKLFDRDFVIGFFLPAVLIDAAAYAVLGAFGFSTHTQILESLTSAAVAIVIVWIISVTLLALNYPMLRLLEGYPFRRHRLRPGVWFWKYRFRKKVEPILNLQQKINQSRKEGKP